MGSNDIGGSCRLAGTKAVVVVHPLKGMGGVVERGGVIISGDPRHGKSFPVAL